MTQMLKMITRYYRETRAAIIVLFAIMAPVLIGASGMALDYAQAYLVQQRLAQAIDASALAATAISGDEAVIRQKVIDFFDVNYPPEKIGATIDPEVSIDGDNVTVTGNAVYYTSFLRVIGIDTIAVTAVTTVRREVSGLEVALVLDVTGSMEGTKIAALRTATIDFIDILFDRVSDERFLRIGMVPYAVTVNLGSEAPNFVNNPIVPARPTVTYNPDDPTQWAGCVMARDYPDDTNDADPTVNNGWDAYWWEHTTGDTINNHWDTAQGGSLNLPYTQCNNRRTPNLGCPVTNPIVPLTNDYEDLIEAAESIVYWCRGGTLGNIGMAWGWRVLSPQEPFTQGAEYENPYWRKAIVMMTDGENQLWRKPDIVATSDYSSYGYISEGVLGTTNRTTGLGIVNTRFSETCEMVKDLGITVYTVTFGSSIIGKPSEQIYIDCASDESKYYPAATNDELIQAFQDISRELSNLRITQ